MKSSNNPARPRGTLTRRLDDSLDQLKKEFLALYTSSDLLCAVTDLRYAQKSEQPTALRRLYEMLDRCGISCDKKRRDVAYYEDLVKSAHLPSYEEIVDKMLYNLYLEFCAHPSPVDFMKRTVNRLCTPEDGWENDTLRLHILKQFVKYGNCLKDANFGGKKTVYDYVKKTLGRKPTTNEVCALLDDGVFDVLETATKEQKRPSGPYGLFKACDDLASAQFRAEGATKKCLYLFAMVFNMTYYTGSKEKSIDYDSDIEINLFRDYYVNNLIRFIFDSYKERLCEFELDPSGRGVNYKNYAEMIYLYFIDKMIPPEEKIARSTEMIDRVCEMQKEKIAGGASLPVNPDSGSFHDKDMASATVDNPFELSENDFMNYLVTYYDCGALPGSGGIGKMQLRSEQNSAFKAYKTILKTLEEKTPKQLDRPEDFLCDRKGKKKKKENEEEEEMPATPEEVLQQTNNYGLWFIDVKALDSEDKREELIRRIGAMLELHGKEEKADRMIEDFITFLQACDRFLRSKDLTAASPEEITRTSLLVLYYYTFNLQAEEWENSRKLSFRDVYDSFANGIDPQLEAAFYQPVSGRSIFDVMLAFSCYARIHDIIF